MTERKEKILENIILEYINTAQPVGSQKIAKVLGLSPATIRNEMLEIEK